jgi:hypothetical protein
MPFSKLSEYGENKMINTLCKREHQNTIRNLEIDIDLLKEEAYAQMMELAAMDAEREYWTEEAGIYYTQAKNCLAEINQAIHERTEELLELREFMSDFLERRDANV